MKFLLISVLIKVLSYVIGVYTVRLIDNLWQKYKR